MDLQKTKTEERRWIEKENDVPLDPRTKQTNFTGGGCPNPSIDFTNNHSDELETTTLKGKTQKSLLKIMKRYLSQWRGYMLIGWVGDALSQRDFNSETLKETKLFTDKKN